MNLTQADDFPIHQTPEPIAHAGSDKNFYDRYFFNGYANGGALSAEIPFFAAAMGFYPNLNIADAAFSFIHQGRQHNLRASKHLKMERMDLEVGPIAVAVEKPLERLRLRVSENEFGIAADILFSRRAPPIEEPRFIRRQGPRAMMDYTRFTQNGTYQGWIRFQEKRITIAPEKFWGTRDRSWGIRPVGLPDSQPPAPPSFPQFFWLWSPINFPDHLLFCHSNEDAEGKPWNKSAILVALEGETIPLILAEKRLIFASGTRHAEEAALRFRTAEGGGGGGREILVRLKKEMNFFMNGIGYLSPDWGHGLDKGAEAIGYDSWSLAEVEETALPFLHVQALCRAEMTGLDQKKREGSGVLEQLILGPHEPSGFGDLLDGAR